MIRPPTDGRIALRRAAILISSNNVIRSWADLFLSRHEDVVNVRFGIGDADDLRLRALGGERTGLAISAEPAKTLLVFDGHLGLAWRLSQSFRLSIKALRGDHTQQKARGCHCQLHVLIEPKPILMIETQSVAGRVVGIVQFGGVLHVQGYGVLGDSSPRALTKGFENLIGR